MSRTSILPIIGIIFTILLFIGFALGLELNSQQRQAEELAHNVAQTLARQLKKDIEQTGDLTVFLDTLDSHHSYNYLDELVRLRLLQSGLEKVKFYNHEGILTYAETKEIVGQDHSRKELLQQALKGKTVSKIVAAEDYLDAYGVSHRTSLIETYMPIFDNHGNVQHVMEVYQNFDPMQKQINAELWRTGKILCLMAVLTFASILYLVRRIHTISREKEMLESLLPICSFCKKIRREDSDKSQPVQWVQLEAYLSETRDLEFSHGLCEDCLEKHYPDPEKS